MGRPLVPVTLECVRAVVEGRKLPRDVLELIEADRSEGFATAVNVCAAALAEREAVGVADTDVLLAYGDVTCR